MCECLACVLVSLGWVVRERVLVNVSRLSVRGVLVSRARRGAFWTGSVREACSAEIVSSEVGE